MIDKFKQYRTRDGREVRIYATDVSDPYPVHGAIRDSGGVWQQESWSFDGRVSSYSTKEYTDDLIEVKPRIKREVWVNVYPKWLAASAMAWPSKKEADEGAAPDRIACVRLTIDCEEGEGL